MVDALEDDGDMMKVEDRAASGYCPLERPPSWNYCSDHRWITEGCNKVWKQWIYHAKRICWRFPPHSELYGKCLYYQISKHRYDRPYCWPCACRAIYTIGCEQGHLPIWIVKYLLGKLMCYS